MFRSDSGVRPYRVRDYILKYSIQYEKSFNKHCLYRVVFLAQFTASMYSQSILNDHNDSNHQKCREYIPPIRLRKVKEITKRRKPKAYQTNDSGRHNIQQARD